MDNRSELLQRVVEFEADGVVYTARKQTVRTKIEVEIEVARMLRGGEGVTEIEVRSPEGEPTSFRVSMARVYATALATLTKVNLRRKNDPDWRLDAWLDEHDDVAQFLDIWYSYLAACGREPHGKKSATADVGGGAEGSTPDASGTENAATD